jgi:hypothetical protein
MTNQYINKRINAIGFTYAGHCNCPGRVLKYKYQHIMIKHHQSGRVLRLYVYNILKLESTYKNETEFFTEAKRLYDNATTQGQDKKGIRL